MSDIRNADLGLLTPMHYSCMLGLNIRAVNAFTLTVLFAEKQVGLTEASRLPAKYTLNVAPLNDKLEGNVNIMIVPGATLVGNVIETCMFMRAVDVQDMEIVGKRR